MNGQQNDQAARRRRRIAALLAPALPVSAWATPAIVEAANRVALASSDGPDQALAGRSRDILAIENVKATRSGLAEYLGRNRSHASGQSARSVNGLRQGGRDTPPLRRPACRNLARLATALGRTPRPGARADTRLRTTNRSDNDLTNDGFFIPHFTRQVRLEIKPLRSRRRSARHLLPSIASSAQQSSYRSMRQLPGSDIQSDHRLRRAS